MAHRPDRPILPRDRTARRDMKRSRSERIRELSQRRSPQQPGRVSFGTAGDDPVDVLRWTCGGGLLGRTSPEQRVARSGLGIVIARLRVPGTSSTVVQLRREGSTLLSMTVPAHAHQVSGELSVSEGWWLSVRTPTQQLAEDAEDLSVELVVR